MSSLRTQRLLVIEDDPVLGNHLLTYLKQESYEVTLCNDGQQGLDIAEHYDFDLILLDILLPGLNGLDVLLALSKGKGTPVILLSALGDEQDRITGFTHGADDYLPKPFSMSELCVRISALLRRVERERRWEEDKQQSNTEQGPFVMFPSRKDVRYAHRWLQLTDTEFRLFMTLWQRRGEVLDKQFLYRQVILRDYSPGDRTLDMHVSHIRRKLNLVACNEYVITTVWMQGYCFEAVQDASLAARQPHG